jgi:hypothetical protein
MFFPELWLCFLPKRIDYSFLLSVVVVVVVILILVVVSIPFLPYTAFFFKVNGSSDGINDECNGFLDLWRCFCLIVIVRLIDWFCLSFSSSLLPLFRFIVVLHSAVSVWILNLNSYSHCSFFLLFAAPFFCY